MSLLVRRPSLLEMTALLKKHVSLHSHSPSPSWSSARVPRRYHTWCPPPGRRMGVGRGGASPCLLYLGETSKDEEDPIPHGGRRTTGGGAGAANGGRDVKGVPVAVRCTRLELGQFELRNFSDSPHACSIFHAPSRGTLFLSWHGPLLGSKNVSAYPTMGGSCIATHLAYPVIQREIFSNTKQI